MLFFTPTHWPWSIVYVQTSIRKEDSGFSAIWTYEAPHVLYVRADVYVMRELMDTSLSENDSEKSLPVPTDQGVEWPPHNTVIAMTYYQEWLAKQERSWEKAPEDTSTPTNPRALREGIQDGGIRHRMTLGS